MTRQAQVDGMPSQSNLGQEIGQLSDLARPKLVERWRKIYRCAPPKGVKRGLLERAIAWHMQAKHYGGLSPSLKRRLKQNAFEIGSDGSAASSSMEASQPVALGPSPSAGSTPLAPGTRLIRGWHGKSHCVDVIEDGFVFEGTTYSSLSAIARQITGARWSGPRFFGL